MGKPGTGQQRQVTGQGELYLSRQDVSLFLHYCGLGTNRGKDGLYPCWWCWQWEKVSLPGGWGRVGSDVAQALWWCACALTQDSRRTLGRASQSEPWSYLAVLTRYEIPLPLSWSLAKPRSLLGFSVLRAETGPTLPLHWRVSRWEKWEHWNSLWPV